MPTVVLHMEMASSIEHRASSNAILTARSIDYTRRSVPDMSLFVCWCQLISWLLRQKMIITKGNSVGNLVYLEFVTNRRAVFIIGAVKRLHLFVSCQSQVPWLSGLTNKDFELWEQIMIVISRHFCRRCSVFWSNAVVFVNIWCQSWLYLQARSAMLCILRIIFILEKVSPSSAFGKVVPSCNYLWRLACSLPYKLEVINVLKLSVL